MPKRCQWSWKMDTIWPNVPRCICSLILIDVWLWYHNFYLSWVSWILFEKWWILSICVFDSITVSGNFVFFPKKSKWIHGLDICQFHDFGLFTVFENDRKSLILHSKKEIFPPKYFEILDWFGAKIQVWKKVNFPAQNIWKLARKFKHCKVDFWRENPNISNYSKMRLFANFHTLLIFLRIIGILELCLKIFFLRENSNILLF